MAAMARVRSLRACVASTAALAVLLAGCRAVLRIDDKELVPESATGGSAGAGGAGGSCPDASAFAADPNNCGSCGHSCLGGDCVDGRCAPIVLDRGDTPVSIALDEDEVFWTDLYGGLVRSTPKSGGSGIGLGEAPGWSPIGVAVSHDYVFVTLYHPSMLGMVVRMDKGRHNDSFVQTSSSYNGPWAVAADGGAVYWTNRYDDVMLASAPLALDTAMSLATAGVPEPVSAEPVAMALDADYVYWTQFVWGVVARTPKIGGATLEIASGQSPALGIAVDDVNVYWGGKTAIWRAPKAGGVLTAIVEVARFSGGVAVDDTHVYWADAGDPMAPSDGSIHRAPKGGTSVAAELLLDGLEWPTNLALDAVAIYWADTDNGTIMKLAK